MKVEFDIIKRERYSMRWLLLGLGLGIGITTIFFGMLIIALI